jgi:hypothetical protein
MPNIDAIANVVVLAAAGVGAILAVVCAVELLRYRHSTDDSRRLTSGRTGRGSPWRRSQTIPSSPP